MPKAKGSYYYNTSQRCKVKSVFEFFVKKNVKLGPKDKHEIFDIMNVFRACGYRILKEFDRTRHNDFNRSDLRARPSLITPAQVREVDKILKEADVDDALMS